MKKLVFLTLAAAVLMFSACTEKDKDNSAVANPSQREVTYTADTREHTAVLHTDAEWHGLLHNLVDSAFRGRNMTVAIDNIEHKPISTKEVVTYTTMSRDSAEAWIARMSENGYRVAFSFDRNSGTYKCVAMDYFHHPDDSYLMMPLGEYIIGTWVWSDHGDMPDTFSFYPDGSVLVHCANVLETYTVTNDSTVRFELTSGNTADIVVNRVAMDTLSVEWYSPTCYAIYVMYPVAKFTRVEM